MPKLLVEWLRLHMRWEWSTIIPQPEENAAHPLKVGPLEKEMIESVLQEFRMANQGGPVRYKPLHDSHPRRGVTHWDTQSDAYHLDQQLIWSAIQQWCTNKEIMFRGVNQPEPAYNDLAPKAVTIPTVTMVKYMKSKRYGLTLPPYDQERFVSYLDTSDWSYIERLHDLIESTPGPKSVVDKNGQVEWPRVVCQIDWQHQRKHSD